MFYRLKTKLNAAIFLGGMIAPLLGAAQKAPPPKTQAEIQQKIEELTFLAALYEDIAATWEHPKWRPLLLACVRGETLNLLNEIASKEAEYSKFEIRSKLDSAKQINQQVKRHAPIIARYRCAARQQVLTVHFAGKVDGKVVATSPNDSPRQILEREKKYRTEQYDDWLPARWAQVRLHMLVYGNDRWLSSGPWAVNQDLIRLLTTDEKSETEIERALSGNGAKVIINQLTLGPYVRLYQELARNIQGSYKPIFTLAGFGKNKLPEVLDKSQGINFSANTSPPWNELRGALVLSIDRALSAMLCEMPETDLYSTAENKEGDLDGDRIGALVCSNIKRAEQK